MKLTAPDLLDLGVIDDIIPSRRRGPTSPPPPICGRWTRR